jgi:hypothetical protein
MITSILNPHEEQPDGPPHVSLAADLEAPSPVSLAGDIDQLLRDPEVAARRACQPPGIARTFRWIALALAALAIYGLAAGSFQGGTTLLLAALKAPLIVLGSVALCTPSLFVFGTLAGSRVKPRGLIAALAGFTLVLALVMLGLVPVAWLFSVSSKSLGFVVFLHLMVWLVALILAHRHLRLLLNGVGGLATAGMWPLLLLVVALQMTTYLRPVLERAPGDPVFAGGKMSFLQHIAKIVDP